MTYTEKVFIEELIIMLEDLIDGADKNIADEYSEVLSDIKFKLGL